MKVLIRKEGETITEDMNIDGIDWNTGAPLTNEEWCGGPYRLAEATEEQIRILKGEAVE